MNPSECCEVCMDCISDPVGSRNIRNNPSAVLSYARPDGKTVNILVDCGKTFRASVLRCFSRLGIEHIDAVILTHAHADAFMGIDDLRDIVGRGKTLPVYTSAACFDVVSRAFSYLVTKPSTPGLHIANLDWRIIEPFIPFEIEGVIVVPLPLLHGPPEPMLGFEFCNVTGTGTDGSGGPEVVKSAQPVVTASDRVVYLSDLAALPAETRSYLLARPISLLVLDALSYNPYPTHFRLRQSVACAMDLRAATTVLTGMNHNVDYRRENPKLRAFGEEHGLVLECGFDGWCTSVEIARVSSIGAVRSEVDAARDGWRAVCTPAATDLSVKPSQPRPGSDAPPSYRYLDLDLPMWEQGQGPPASTTA